MGLPAVPHPCVNWSLGLLRRLGSFHEYELLIGADDVNDVRSDVYIRGEHPDILCAVGVGIWRRR